MVDLDGDNRMEIVQATAAGRIYAFRADGSQLPGFPVTTNMARNVATHLAAPAFASGRIAPPSPTTTSRPAIGDLDHDGYPEIVYANIEGDVYVFRHDGTPFPGFPVRINPAFSAPVLRTNTNHVKTGILGSPVLAAAFAAAGGSGRIYALQHDGTLHSGGPFVPGWPVKLDGLAINILPLIGPGHNVAVGDLDPSPGLEVAASLTTSNLVLFRPDGTRLRDMDPSAHGALSDTAQDNSSVLNLFEYPAIGDLDRDGKLDLAKVGVTLNGLVNLVLVGQNEPFHHVLQAWNAATGQPLEGFPKVIDDFGLTTVPLLANVGATVDPGDTLNLPELVSANGLYLVHAFDFTGREPANWPKLTGGGDTGAPAPGGGDDDGLPEIAWPTPEGDYFLLDNPAPI